MSLPALMRLMGNADIQTTLQHVRITPQDVYLEYARAVAQHIRLSRRLRYESRARPPRQHPLAAAQQNICSRTCGSAIDLESEPCVQLNLTRRAYGGEYSAHVVGEIPCCILEDRVSVASQGKGTLGVARDCEIRMIEQIVGFHTKRNLRAFRQFEGLLQRQVKLRERGAAQDIAPSSTKLTGRW